MNAIPSSSFGSASSSESKTKNPFKMLYLRIQAIFERVVGLGAVKQENTTLKATATARNNALRANKAALALKLSNALNIAVINPFELTEDTIKQAMGNLLIDSINEHYQCKIDPQNSDMDSILNVFFEALETDYANAKRETEKNMNTAFINALNTKLLRPLNLKESPCNLPYTQVIDTIYHSMHEKISSLENEIASLADQVSDLRNEVKELQDRIKKIANSEENDALIDTVAELTVKQIKKIVKNNLTDKIGLEVSETKSLEEMFSEIAEAINGKDEQFITRLANNPKLRELLLENLHKSTLQENEKLNVAI